MSMCLSVPSVAKSRSVVAQNSSAPDRRACAKISNCSRSSLTNSPSCRRPSLAMPSPSVMERKSESERQMGGLNGCSRASVTARVG